jgi:hypothetical protein
MGKKIWLRLQNFEFSKLFGEHYYYDFSRFSRLMDTLIIKKRNKHTKNLKYLQIQSLVGIIAAFVLFLNFEHKKKSKKNVS